MGSEDEIIFYQEDFMSKSFDVFEDMRRKAELVDFKVNLKNCSVVAHRLVLAARIPHFRKIFCSPQADIFLEEADLDVLESVIDFAYSGKIKITPRNVSSLLSVAKVLQLTAVYDACWEFVERRFHSINVLQFRRLANDHGCSKFLDAADNYIRQNFEDFTKSESFVDLPFHQLKEIISRDDIRVSTEEKMFEAVVTWVKSSESERRDLLPELLSAVRMYFLTPDYLIERVSAEELVRSSLLCRDLVEEAKSYHLLPDKRSKFCRLSSQPRLYERKSVSPLLPSQPGHKNMLRLPADDDPGRSLIFAVYRTLEDQVVKVKQFDTEEERWIQLSSYIPLKPAVVVSLGEVIYIFATPSVLTFNASSRKWASSKCVESVSHSGVVSYNGKIYFFGGDSEDSHKVRSFDPGQNKFLEECRMRRPLSCAGVALLSSSRKTALTSETFIYITGGAFKRCVYDDVEKYNPETREWLDLPSMFYERQRHGCCNLKDKIYVCGGQRNEWELLSSAEVFDPLTNQWNIIASMTEAKKWLSVISHDEKVYVYGLSDNFSTNRGSMEIYDTKNDEWKIRASIRENNRTLEVFLVKAAVSVDILGREGI